MSQRTRIAILVAAALTTAAVVAGVVVAAGDGRRDATPAPCRTGSATQIAQPTEAELRAAGLDELPLAPTRRRVDLAAPPFSRPTEISNPLFPIRDLHSALLNGVVDGKAFRVEVTLLPATRPIELARGSCVETLVSQYAAYLAGRLHEVALDHYAQADDGSVWYLGEDVFNYADGAVADRLGTWIAGRDGAAAMIMPGAPKAGAAYRPENIPGLVFEEVSVEEVGKTVAGPRGPVRGAIVIRELHADGAFEAKQFAPGYGEFFTASGGDVEALALAVPTDARRGPVPAALRELLAGAKGAFDDAAAGRWQRAARAAERVSAGWSEHRRGDVPPRLEEPTAASVEQLADAVAGGKRAAAQQAAIDVIQAALDLQLQFRPVAGVDLDRFDLWLRQLLVDVRARNEPAVAGDVSTLEWIRDRVAHVLPAAERARVDTLLVELREAERDDDLAAAVDAVEELRKLLGQRR